MEHMKRTLQNYLNEEKIHFDRTPKKGQKCNA